MLISSGAIFDWSYINDSRDSGTSYTDIMPCQTQTFTYEHRNRLTSVTGPTTADNDTYRYDAIGNLLQKNGQSYTY